VIKESLWNSSWSVDLTKDWHGELSCNAVGTPLREGVIVYSSMPTTPAADSAVILGNHLVLIQNRLSDAATKNPTIYVRDVVECARLCKEKLDEIFAPSAATAHPFISAGITTETQVTLCFIVRRRLEVRDFSSAKFENEWNVAEVKAESKRVEARSKGKKPVGKPMALPRFNVVVLDSVATREHFGASHAESPFWEQTAEHDSGAAASRN